MLLIRPLKITPAMVTASNAGAADPTYNAATSYALGARVYLPENGKTYECVQAPAQGQDPATQPLYWMQAAPSNRWSMFDSEISTATVTPGNLTTTITVPQRFNSMAFFGLVGASIVVTQRSPSGELLKQFSKSLRAPPTNWYEYFYDDFWQLPEAVFIGFQPVLGSRIEVTITGPAACAAAVIGNMVDIGEAQWGATTSIIDYSRKDVTAAGVQTFLPGRFSRRLSIVLELPRERYPVVQRVLESVRATPCVWVGAPGVSAYSPMTIFGFFRDFSIEVAHVASNICSLEIESIT